MINYISELSKSPFIVSQPVSGGNFFDRDDIFIQIKDFVASGTKHVFLVHGQRRIGKTSLLWKLFETANKEWNAHTVFFNLQGHAVDTVNELISEIANTINKSFKHRKDIQKQSFAEISHFYETFIPEKIRLLNDKKLILLFDEFDTIGTAEYIADNTHKNMAFNAFIPYIERMVEFLQQHNIPVKLIIACGRNYKDLEENRYGQLLKSAQQAEIYIFSRPQTENLIAMANVHIPFSAEAIDTIFDITGGHPMFTQCVCDAAFRFAENNKIPKITPDVIKNIYEDVIKQNASAVLWIWHTLTDKAKIVLFIAAHLADIDVSINTNNILRKAREWFLMPATDDLDDALDLLLRNRFIKQYDNGSNYIFCVEFIRKWIVLEVNKESINKLLSGFDDDTKFFIANARYFFKHKEWTNCKDYCLKIIKKFEGHYEAIFQLMVCYAKLGDIESSYLFYEKALKINFSETNEMITRYGLSFSGQITNSIIKHIGSKLHTSLIKVDIENAIDQNDTITADYTTNDYGKIIRLRIRNFELNSQRLMDIFQFSEFVQTVVYEALNGLTYLDLSNDMIDDISIFQTISIFQNLTIINLKNNQIRDISPLDGLNQIEEVNLSSNLIRDISVFLNPGCFQNISDLDLSNNHISNINPLKELKNVKNLNISENKLSNISPEKELNELFWECHKPYLYYLNASNCALKNLFVQNCPNLQILFLFGNGLEEINFEGKFLKLARIDLSKNSLSKIDLPFENFPSLKHLYLNENRLIDLSGLTDFFEIEDFNFNIWNNDTITNPPSEIVEQGKEAVINYFKQISDEGGRVEYLFETKVLIIGEGGTGKTSFAIKMKNPSSNLPKDEDTTPGIEVTKWKFKIEHPQYGNQTMLTNFWDFGGQKLYQGTHQIFFSVKSYYVLLDDSREDSTDFAYWLNTVEQLAGADSKLLIVANIKHGHKPQIDSNGLKGRFGELIDGIIEVDLERDLPQTEKLQNKLKYFLSQLPGIGDPLPPSWKKIREELSTINENSISSDKYLEICRIKKTNMAELDVLNEYFNRIGVFTYYSDDPVLRQRVFLNSNWLLKTVYSVLNDDTVKSGKGRITLNQLNSLWCDEDTRLETGYLSRLMHRLGLMYEIADKDVFIIPSHLSIEQPYKEWIYENEPDILQFAYKFDKYMPRGIMPRLIVALHPYINNNERVWKSGFNIAYNADTIAEIKESYEKPDTFQIRIFGAEKKEFKGIIAHELNKILEPYKKLNYEITVPCNCKECRNNKLKHFFKLSTLNNLKSKKIPPTQAQAMCEISGELVSVNTLLDVFEFNNKFLDVLEFNNKEEIEQLLMNGDLSKAIEELLKGTKANGQTRLHNDLILQSARNNNNEGENRKGIIPSDEYRREKARITYAVQSYLGDYLPLAKMSAKRDRNDQVPVQDVPKRTDIFISYSHHAEDQRYFDEIKRQLKSLKAYGLDVKVWDDTQMRTGDDWLAEITKALQATRVGVLLVSQNFLASDFITTKEIPALLDNVKTEGGKIMSVLLRQTPIKMHPVLKNYQAANPPEKPLNTLTEPEKDAVYVKLLEDILHFYGITGQ